MCKLFVSRRLCLGVMCYFVVIEVEDFDIKKVIIMCKEKIFYLLILNKWLFKIGGCLRELGF